MTTLGCMTNDERRLKGQSHSVDATLRVDKSGIESIADELDSQLVDRDLKKVKFLRAAHNAKSTDEHVARLGECVGSGLIEARGNTTTSL